MWIYSQATGRLWDDNGNLKAVGYSGNGSGKNNPARQGLKNVGPIPRGLYSIGDWYHSKRIGPYAIPVNPVDHNCLGRTYFRIHGDSRSDPGNASKGCMIFPPDIRQDIIDSDDNLLKVIE